MTRVFQTRQAARLDDYASASGEAVARDRRGDAAMTDTAFSADALDR
jgi:hypothetical protein